MRLYTMLGGLVLAGMPAMASAHHADFHFGINLPLPSINIGFGHSHHADYYRGPIVRGYYGPSAYFGPSFYYAPPVVYAPPTVVYTTPAPVYVQQAPVYAPAPVYVPQQQTYVAPGYYPQPAPRTYYYGR